MNLIIQCTTDDITLLRLKYQKFFNKFKETKYNPWVCYIDVDNIIMWNVLHERKVNVRRLLKELNPYVLYIEDDEPLQALRGYDKVLRCDFSNYEAGIEVLRKIKEGKC